MDPNGLIGDLLGFEEKAGGLRWHLRHRSWKILADRGHGHADRGDVWEAIESIKRDGPAAEIEGQLL